MGKKCNPLPVKRLNGKLKGSVNPNGSGTRRYNLRSNTPHAVYRRPSVLRRRGRSYSSFKNFINKFRRANPGSLLAEGVSIWRKMSRQEKRPFQRSSAARLHENPSTHTQVQDEQLSLIANDEELSLIANDAIVLVPSIEVNQSRTDSTPSIFNNFLKAIYRAMHLFY
ncbi:uncharacterized protein Dere_GG26515 [Drosophila erecta]|uniref:HMG box domain-containing protein n=1 Tax=Drosophila erecta TaxID=7220 RepID=A0A0Q5WAS6_DROER|nr:uncharacterized protein Dere_GG26515 [Drosophila erecta]